MKFFIFSLLLFISIKSHAHKELDVLILADVMHCEAGKEGKVGMLAVADVVMNRVKNKHYPNSIVEVVTQPHQFECIQKGVSFSLKNAIHQRVIDLAWQVLDGKTPHITDATHYYASWLPEEPYWADKSKFLGRIGNHLFYKLR